MDVVCQQCLYSLAHTQHTTRLPVVSMVHARFCIVTSSCVMCVVCTLDIHVEIEILFNVTLSILPQKRHHSSSLQSTQSAKLNFVGDLAVQSAYLYPQQTFPRFSLTNYNSSKLTPAQSSTSTPSSPSIILPPQQTL